MPVEIESPPQTPGSAHRPNAWGRSAPRAAGLRVALINNMPDSALGDTEEQFLDLLAAASGDRHVGLTLHYLPGVPRGPEAGARLAHDYFSLPALLARRYDGVIVTGTEPCQADLRAETYWPALTTLLAWAESHTSSAILSCMAAHAAVLHASGIERRRLPTKRLGIFRERVMRPHPLTAGAPAATSFPHSRWNDLPAADLAAHGYELLTLSDTAGAGLFTKQRGRSLFVHVQGHPEYQAATLLKEYRRDVRRFLQGQRPDYPELPRNYFDPPATQALAQFQRRVLADPRPGLMTEFPDAAIAARLRRSWAADAERLYSNWLGYLAARSLDTPAAVAGRAASVS